MITTAALLYLYLESPLHAGVGFREDTPADRPIQREEATGYPLIRASSLKGAFRTVAQATAGQQDVLAAFGPEPEALAKTEGEEKPKDTKAFAAALVLGDAHLLLFPVRSLVGVFAWATSADALARFRRDATAYNLSPKLAAFAPPPEGTAWVTPNSRVLTPKSQLILEELTFKAQARPETAALSRWFAETVIPQTEVFGYWADKVQRDLVVLPEADFRFLLATRTEIIHRIRLDRKTGTAVAGALWTEEFLPADTVLYAPVGAQDPAQPGKQLKSAPEVLAWFQGLGQERIQVGGGRTLGRGIVHLRWQERSND